MSAKDSFELVWHFQRDQWDRLRKIESAGGQTYLPKKSDGVIDSVYLVINGSWVQLNVWYWPIKKDGKKSVRRRNDFTYCRGRDIWMYHLFPNDLYSLAEREAIRRLWPVEGKGDAL